MHTTTVTALSDVDQPDALLTAADEAALVHRIDAGLAAAAALTGRLRRPGGARAAELGEVAADGERARLDLARANIALVWFVVHPISRTTGREPHELFQEGIIGLLEAIQRFDPRLARFSTYAVPRIRMRVWDAATTEHGGLGISARRARQWRQARSVAAGLTLVLARTPRAEEVAAETGESVGVTRALLTYAPPVVLSPHAEAWDDLTPVDPQRLASEAVDRVAVRRLLRRLDDVNRALVSQLFGLDGPARTHAEVARELGRSESTIRRREKTALGLLRAGTDPDLAA